MSITTPCSLASLYTPRSVNKSILHPIQSHTKREAFSRRHGCSAEFSHASSRWRDVIFIVKYRQRLQLPQRELELEHSVVQTTTLHVQSIRKYHRIAILTVSQFMGRTECLSSRCSRSSSCSLTISMKRIVRSSSSIQIAGPRCYGIVA